MPITDVATTDVLVHRRDVVVVDVVVVDSSYHVLSCCQAMRTWDNGMAWQCRRDMIPSALLLPGAGTVDSCINETAGPLRVALS